MNSAVQPMSIGGRLLTKTEAQSVQRHIDFHRKIAERAIDLPPVLPPSTPHAPEPDPPRMVEPLSFKETWFSIVPPQRPCKLSVRQIKEMVCEHFGVRMIDLTSARRTKDVVVPRMVAVYLCRELTERSLPEIGRQFGGRDHTTALHSVRSVPEKMARDPQLADSVVYLRKSLEALL